MVGKKTMINKETVYPTAKKMEEFSKNYSPDQWEILCEDQRFLDLVGGNIGLAKVRAEKILSERKR